MSSPPPAAQGQAPARRHRVLPGDRVVLLQIDCGNFQVHASGGGGHESRGARRDGGGGRHILDQRPMTDGQQVVRGAPPSAAGVAAVDVRAHGGGLAERRHLEGAVQEVPEAADRVGAADVRVHVRAPERQHDAGPRRPDLLHGPDVARVVHARHHVLRTSTTLTTSSSSSAMEPSAAAGATSRVSPSRARCTGTTPRSSVRAPRACPRGASPSRTRSRRPRRWSPPRSESRDHGGLGGEGRSNVVRSTTAPSFFAATQRVTRAEAARRGPRRRRRGRRG